MGQIIIVLFLVLLLDLYVFQAVKTVMSSAGPQTKITITVIYWTISILTFGFILAIPYLRQSQISPFWRTYPLAVLLGIFIAKFISIAFFLIDDVRRIIQWVITRLWTHNTDVAEGHEVSEYISRSTFLSWLGLGIGGGLFGSLLFGFKNKYNYQVRTLNLHYKNLPKSFSGLKIIQISDIHSGSFTDREAVLSGIEKINALKPDLILFTGDLVNDRASEMKPFMDVFDKLIAPLGVFSTLGNHDYGDYAAWNSQEEKRINLEELKSVHRQLGWRLLMDESVLLEKDGETISLIGVQNISGKARFHSYGNLGKAYADSVASPFKILMSHDPSHWDSEVKQHFPDIDLTLSGHTHGMQFGVELPGFKWSPVKWVYKQWAGLYEDKHQKLYVNRGFGFIGYPGRVGILPEITLIELT